MVGGDFADADANFFIYDDSGNFEEPLTDSTSFGDGKGFAMYFFNNSANNSNVLSDTLDLLGSDPSSDVLVNLNKSTTSGGLNHYFTLLGNPYSSNFNLDSLIQNGTGLQDNVHFWDDEVGSYASEDRTASGGFIASPWQGFWVEVSNAGTTTLVTIPNSGKTSKDTTATYFSKKMNNSGDLFFTLKSKSTFDKAIRIAFRGYATNEIDRADASKMIPLVSSYATMAFNSNELLKSVESLPYNLEEEITLSLQTQLVGVDGEFTFAWNGLETIPGEWEIILHDYVEGATLNMREVSEYIFSAKSDIQAKLNPLSILSDPAMLAMKAKTNANRFAIKISPTSSDSSELDEVAHEFALDQNYPNPFNPSTTINYSVESTGEVNISVYNLMGQKVAELVNATKTAGSYHVTWDASSVSSGMYFYQLTAGKQTLTKRMTLIK